MLVTKDGNKYPIKLLRDNKLWMNPNLKLIIPDSYCYNDTMKYCKQYGRLYTWESVFLEWEQFRILNNASHTKIKPL